MSKQKLNLPFPKTTTKLKIHKVNYRFYGKKTQFIKNVFNQSITK